MSAPVGTAPGEVRLRRVLGLPALVFFGLAYMVPLTVWTTYGIVTTSTEGHLPLAYLVTTIAMALTAYSYGRMVLVQPIAGSAYSYASRAFGRAPGFMVGWALVISLTTVSSMISFGALAAFSFVNLSVIKTYVIDGGRRSGADIVKYAAIPFLGFAFTIHLWTKLSELTFQIGLAWLAVGLLYLVYLTRAFRRPPPAMYTGDEDD